MDSRWIKYDVGDARNQETRHGKKALFLVRIDETVIGANQAWAAEIRRTHHIGDFSRWKDENAYQKALKRLLRALKEEDIEILET